MFSCSVVSDSLQPLGLEHARLPCPSLSPRVFSNSYPLSRWFYPTISSSVIPFCLQSFLASGSFPMSQLSTSGGLSVGASTSVLPMSIQGWFPLRLTGLISLQSKGFSRVFSTTTVWKHHFFWAQPSLWSNSHICTLKSSSEILSKINVLFFPLKWKLHPSMWDIWVRLRLFSMLFITFNFYYLYWSIVDLWC